MTSENQSPAQFPAPGEVRLVRILPGPVERIWQYLTDPEKRALWFAGGPMEPKVGGKLELHFRHEDIAPNETPPEQSKDVHDPGVKSPGTVLRWEPPHVLSFSFSDDSDVTFELSPQGRNVRMVVIHRSRGEDLPSLTGFASGWHTHFNHLLSLLEDTPRPPFWSTFLRLKEEYEKLRAASPDA